MADPRRAERDALERAQVDARTLRARLVDVADRARVAQEAADETQRLRARMAEVNQVLLPALKKEVEQARLLALRQKREFSEAHPRRGWAVTARAAGVPAAMVAFAAVGFHFGDWLWPAEGAALAWAVGGAAAAGLVHQLWQLGRELGAAQKPER